MCPAPALWIVGSGSEVWISYDLFSVTGSQCDPSTWSRVELGDDGIVSGQLPSEVGLSES